MGVFPVTPASLAAQPSTSPWTWWGHGLSSVAPPAPTVPEERGRLPDPHGACGHCACARTPRGLGPRTLPWPSVRPPARAGGRALSAGLPSLFRSAATAASQSTEDGATGAGRGPGPAGQRLGPRGPASASRPGGRLLFRPHLAKTEPLPRQRRHLRGTGAEGDGRGEDGGRPKRGRPGVRGAADGRTGRSARTRALEVSRRPTRHARPDGEGSGEGCAGPAGSHARRRCRGSEMPPSTVVTSPTAPLYWLPHPTPIAAVPKRSRRPAAMRGSRGGFAGRADRPGAHGPRPASRGHYPLPPPFGGRRGDPGGRADGGPPRPTAGGGTPQARGRGQLGTGTRSHEKTRGPGRGDSGQTRSKPLQSRRLETFLQSG